MLYLSNMAHNTVDNLPPSYDMIPISKTHKPEVISYDYNPPNRISAVDAHKLAIDYCNNRYKEVMKEGFKWVYDIIKDKATNGNTNIRITPFSNHHKLNFPKTDELKEKQYYELMCNKLQKMLIEDGYKVKYEESDDEYGIPGYKYFTTFIIITIP